MVKDRLFEFQQMSGLNKNVNKKRESMDGQNSNGIKSTPPNETTSFLQVKSADEMETFLEEVQVMQMHLNEMGNCLNRMRELHQKILNEPGVQPKFTDELNRSVERFVILSRDILARIKKMKDENGRKNSKITPANLRIRTNQETNLRRSLLKLTEEFHSEQVDYKQKCRKRIKDYLRISGNQMPEDEIDQAIESGQLFNTVGILMADREKKMLFEDVKSRHEDIMRLEKSIRELHDMFQDLAMLVENQGEMVYHIETNVTSATEYALNALSNVKTAQAAKQRYIKLKIGLAICCVITIILLFFMGTSLFCFYFSFLCK